MKLLLLITTLLFSSQTPSQLSSVVGTVVAIEKTSKTVTLKTDQNASILIKPVDIIPRNFGDGPGYFSVNLRVAKTINFGPLPRVAAAAPGGNQPQGARPAGPAAEVRPYRLTFSIALANILNRTNSGPRIGNLTSPLFGLSNSLAQFTPLGTGGGAATSNRSVALRAQFNF